MSFVLDAILVLFILFMALLSARKGFVCTLVEVVGFFLAIIIVRTALLTSVSFLNPDIAKWISLPIVFILLMVFGFVIKFIAKFVNKIFNFSVIGKVNRLLGGILGLIKGIAFSAIFCIIIGFILSYTDNGFLIFTPNAINSSYLFKFFMGFLPF